MGLNKSLAKNSVYNVAYKLLNVLFPLITATYIARVLLAGGVGKVSYAQNIVSYFAVIAALGIPNYGIREIAKVRENRKMTSELFSELFVINFISTVFCTIAYYCMIFSVNIFRENLQLYMVVGFSMIFSLINVDWFYQGVEEYAYIAKRSFAVKMISLICIFLFVRTGADITAYAIIYCLGIGGNNLLNIINLRKHKVGLTFTNLSVKKHLKPIFILLASVIAIELYTMVDTTMIGIMCDDSNVGYYTNAMKLVKLLIGVITAIGGVLLPRLSYYYVRGLYEECSRIVSKVFSIMLYLFLPCAIGLLLVSGQIMPLLFGGSFEPAVVTLRIASLLICTLGFSNLFGTQVLLTYGAEKKLLACTIAGAATNIALNAVLIPNFAQNGAAAASVASEMMVTVLALVFSMKYIQLYIDKKFLLSLAVSALGLTISVGLIQATNLCDILKLILSIGVGSIMFFSLSLLTKNAVAQDIVAILKTHAHKLRERRA